MLNHVVLIGRLTRDVELKRTPTGISVCPFTVAVERDGKAGEDGSRAVDYIDCVAWRNTAEMMSKYLGKGRKILVEGRLQVRNWTAENGGKRRSAEVVVSRIEFADSKRSEVHTAETPADTHYDNGMRYEDTEPYESPYSGFHPIEDDGDLPF